MKIYVKNHQEKEKLLKESEYIHDFLEIVKYKNQNGQPTEKWIGLDSDKAGTLMHIYMNPDLIVVESDYLVKQLCPVCKEPLKPLYDEMTCFKCMKHYPKNYK